MLTPMRYSLCAQVMNPEEIEPVPDPAWPHLQPTYHLLLSFVVNVEDTAKVSKSYINRRFCSHLVQLFDSPDPRERDLLKTILHRVYSKFMGLRGHIRAELANVFCSFVFETQRHNGIGEFLEVLGSIISGFLTPLKSEHGEFR